VNSERELAEADAIADEMAERDFADIHKQLSECQTKRDKLRERMASVYASITLACQTGDSVRRRDILEGCQTTIQLALAPTPETKSEDAVRKAKARLWLTACATECAMSGIPEDIVRGNQWRSGADVSWCAFTVGAAMTLAALVILTSFPSGRHPADSGLSGCFLSFEPLATTPVSRATRRGGGELLESE
jgi:hypothetical protein